ncbi:phage tail protein [Laribacter hongkongensis]|uniref:Phage tail protein n=1 Tax=Laribacter hongkongensis TaxID=168471 RepID=A0ABD4SPS3_9NEIS|nr:phage tail protein [Laribacter hongkongensis]MCG9025477.1 phage tail protein [Laribacter hongkongensis]
MPPIGTADNLFHDGNPATGELGTIVSAEWLNNMQGALRGNQSELIALLTAAGAKPDAQKTNQLLTALQALFLGKSSQAADSAKLGGQLPSHYLDLANSAGTLDLTGTRKLISTLSSRARVVTDLVQYRGWASETGAIAFVAPPGDSVMAALEIAGFEYGGGANPKHIELGVWFYRSSTQAGFQRTSTRSSGAYTPAVRLGVKRGTNQTALIIGNIDEAWGYPHIAVTKALLGHTGLTDAMCTGWTSELVTSLDDFENIVELKDTAADAGADPLLWPRTSPSRTHIQAGYAPLDGQELSRALYPDAWAAIQSGVVPVVTEAEWQADPLKRGAWTYGNGSTTFRMPDWNGKSAGSKGAVFVRGDGALSAGTPGMIQGDAIRNITGEFQDGAGTGANAFYGVTGAFGVSTVDSGSGRTAGSSTPLYKMSFDASRVVPTAPENRPLNVTSVWVCRLFGSVTNPGAADAAQLATEVARLWAQLSGKQDISSAYGPSLRNVSYTSAQRASGVVYYNTSGVPRTVFAQASTMSGFTLGSISKTLNLATVSLTVMPGEAYSVTYQSTLNFWIETTKE